LANFPIIKENSLCDLSAFVYKAIERHSLFFFCPERYFVTKVLSGSLQKPYKSQQYRIDIESISSRRRIHIKMILTSNLHQNEVVTIRIQHWHRHRINVITIL